MNMLGEYKQQQFSYGKQIERCLDKPFASASRTCFPGAALLPGKIHHAHLTHNGTDVESFLFGIGATNLFQPANSHDTVYNQEKAPLASLNLVPARNETIMPEKTVVRLGQRPYLSTA